MPNRLILSYTLFSSDLLGDTKSPLHQNPSASVKNLSTKSNVMGFGGESSKKINIARTTERSRIMPGKIDQELKASLPLSGSRGAEKLGRLKRRAEFLKVRIAEADVDGRDLHYDRAALTSLEWVIECMPRLEQRVFELQGEVSKLEESLIDLES